MQSWWYLSTPPQIHEHIVIAIGLICGNHYVKVELEGKYPNCATVDSLQTFMCN